MCSVSGKFPSLRLLSSAPARASSVQGGVLINAGNGNGAGLVFLVHSSRPLGGVSTAARRAGATAAIGIIVACAVGCFFGGSRGGSLPSSAGGGGSHCHVGALRLIPRHRSPQGAALPPVLGADLPRLLAAADSGQGLFARGFGAARALGAEPVRPARGERPAAHAEEDLRGRLRGGEHMPSVDNGVGRQRGLGAGAGLARHRLGDLRLDGHLQTSAAPPKAGRKDPVV